MSNCRSRSLTKLLMALLLFVETLGHIFAEDAILDDEDFGGAAAAPAPLLRHLVSESSSWQLGMQRLRNHPRLMLSRLLMLQGRHHHGDRHPEMHGVAERESERIRRMSPVIIRGTGRGTDGESMTRLRLLPSGQSQVGPAESYQLY